MIVFLNWLKDVLDALICRLRITDSPPACDVETENLTSSPDSQDSVELVDEGSARPTETVNSCSKSETASQAHKKRKKKKSSKSKLNRKVTVTENQNTIAPSGNPPQHRIPTESSLPPSTDRTIGTEAESGLNSDVLCPPHSNTTHEVNTEILDFHDNAVEGDKTLNAGSDNSGNLKEAEISDTFDDNGLPWQQAGPRKQKPKAKSLPQSEISQGSQDSASTNKIANSCSKPKKFSQAYTKKQTKTSSNSKLGEKMSVTGNSNTKSPFGSSSHRRIPTETSLPPSTMVRTTGVGTCAGISYSEAVKRTSSTKTDVKTDLTVTDGNSGRPSVDFFNVRENDNVITSDSVSANTENQTGDNAQIEQVNSNLELSLSSQTSSNCPDLIASNRCRFNPVVGLPVTFPNLSCNLYKAIDNSLRILEGEDDTFSDPFDSDFSNDSVQNFPSPSLPVINTLSGQFESQAPVRIQNQSPDVSIRPGRSDTFYDPRNSMDINSNLVEPSKPSLNEPDANKSSVSEDASASVVTTVHGRIFIRGVPHIYTNSQLFPQILPECAVLNPHTFSVYPNRAFPASHIHEMSNITVRHNSAYRLVSNSDVVPHTLDNRMVSDRTEQRTLADRPISNDTVPHRSDYQQVSNSAILHTSDNRQTLNRPFLNTSGNRPVSDSAVLHTSTYRQTSNSVVLHTSDARQTIEPFNTINRDNRAVLHTSANRPVSDSVISQNSTSRPVSITRSHSFPGHPIPNNAFHHTGNQNFAAFSGPHQVNSTPPPQRPGSFQYPPLRNVYQPHDQAYDNFTRASHSGMGQPIPSVPSPSTAFSPQSFSYQSTNPQRVQFIPRPNSTAAFLPGYNTEQPSNLPFSHQAATGIQTVRQTNNQSVTYQTYDSPSGLRTVHAVETEFRQTCYTRQFTRSDDSPSTELSRPYSNLRNIGGRNRHYRSITNPTRFRNCFAQHVSPPVNALKLPGKPRSQLSAKELHPRGVNLDGPSSKPTYPNLPVSAEENEDVSGEEKHGRTRSVSEIPNPRHSTNAQPGQQSGFRRSTSYPGPSNKRNEPSISKKE